ncbi:MAG TPA: DNA-binding protein [Firmicutes bacterium]|nr:DNA-binding protein [Bacillota bacterium]
MLIKEGSVGRKLMGRFEHGADLLQALEELVEKEGIKAGALSLIGAVQEAKVAFFDQVTKEYKTIEFPESMEILSCSGNISLKDGKPFAHVHIILGDKEGRVWGGHLLPGTRVFAAEFVVEELAGIELEREYDATTSLSLWQK